MKNFLFLAMGILLLIFLLSGIFWRYGDQMLDTLARPQIETLASKMLDADILIGQLRWTKSGLEIFDLQVSTTQVNATVPQVTLNFTLASLWNRQFKELLIREPYLEITPSPERNKQENLSLSFAEQLPINIELLSITGGEIDLETPAGLLRISVLNFTGALQPQSRFSLSAFIGSGKQQPIAINGTLQYSPQQILTLDNLSWQGQHLLNDPLSLELSGGELALDGNRIGLSHFDDVQLQNLFKSLGHPSPLPADLTFSLTDASIKVYLDRSSLQLELKVDQGQVAWNSLNSDFSALQMTLDQGPQGWNIVGQFAGPASSSFDFNAQINDTNNLVGQMLINVPDPGQFKEQLIGGPALKIKGSLHMAADFLWADERLEITSVIRGNAATSPAATYLVDIGRINGQGTLLIGDGQETFTLTLRQDSQPFVSVSGTFQEFKMSLAGVNLDIIKQLLTPDLIPSQIASISEVKIAGDVSAEFSEAGYTLKFEKLSLSDLNYNSADGLSGVGAAALALQGQINGSWSAESIALDLRGTLAAREVLAGVFYADLSNHQVDFSLRGELNIDTGELTARLLEINLPKFGKLAANGQVSPDRITLQGHFNLIELSSSYGEQLKPLLRDLQPNLTNLDLAGQLALDYQLHWQPTGWLAHGAVIFKALNAHWQQQLEMINGNGSIPFLLGNGTQPDTATTVTKASGDINFGALSVGPATVEQGTLQLVADLNQIAILTPLQLSLAGGHLTIEDVSLGWLKRQPQGTIKIDIVGVNLGPLNRELGLPSMQGNLNANLGTIHYRDRQLSTAGIANIEVFGGRFKFSNMRYSEPLSRHPVFYADIDFTGLDLQKATHTFDFGEMNGILDGYVHGLRLFGTTPAAFEASVATRENGTRNISVKALNNLSILSQGGLSAALSQGIYQFIDFYRYRKIAFDCSLVNDTFTLIGAASPGSNRYLVSGGLLPPRIDITTSTPTISFKEMVNRLGRIDRAGSRKKSTDPSNKGE